MKDKVITIDQALAKITNGMRIMVGGFLAVGTAHLLVDALLKSDRKDLEVVCSDTGYADRGVGKLITARKVRKVFASHVGTNAETGLQYNSGELDVELIPQGTLAERIRVAGAGLGAVITPVGIGTMVAEGKQILTLDGKDYLIEKPLTADVAFIKAWRGDRIGNLQYHKTAENMNPVMATATKLVIAEVDELLEVGNLDPDLVDTPSIFTDFVVTGGRHG